jgi:hypothetical protein
MNDIYRELSDIDPRIFEKVPCLDWLLWVERGKPGFIESLLNGLQSAKMPYEVSRIPDGIQIVSNKQIVPIQVDPALPKDTIKIGDVTLTNIQGDKP